MTEDVPEDAALEPGKLAGLAGGVYGERLERRLLQGGLAAVRLEILPASRGRLVLAGIVPRPQVELDVGDQVRRRRPLVVGKHLTQTGNEAYPLSEARPVGGAAACAVEQPHSLHIFEEVFDSPASGLLGRPGAQEFGARLACQDRFDLLRRERHVVKAPREEPRLAHLEESQELACE